MTNCQKTNYEVKWSQCVKQLPGFWGFLEFSFPCIMFYTTQPLELMVIVPYSMHSSTISHLDTLGKLPGKLLGWFYQTSFFSWKKRITNTETSKSVLLFDTLCFFTQVRQNYATTEEGKAFQTNQNSYSSLLLSSNTSTAEKLPLDPDYIPHLKKAPFSLSCSLHF